MIAVCGCEGTHELFRWRGDPAWWSCVCCDGRVRLITEDEKRELETRTR